MRSFHSDFCLWLSVKCSRIAQQGSPPGSGEESRLAGVSSSTWAFPAPSCPSSPGPSNPIIQTAELRRLKLPSASQQLELGEVGEGRERIKFPRICEIISTSQAWLPLGSPTPGGKKAPCTPRNGHGAALFPVCPDGRVGLLQGGQGYCRVSGPSQAGLCRIQCSQRPPQEPCNRPIWWAVALRKHNPVEGRLNQILHRVPFREVSAGPFPASIWPG